MRTATYLANTSSRDATDDANSSHHLARVEFTPHEDGTYYIAGDRRVLRGGRLRADGHRHHAGCRRAPGQPQTRQSMRWSGPRSRARSTSIGRRRLVPAEHQRPSDTYHDRPGGTGNRPRLLAGPAVARGSTTRTGTTFPAPGTTTAARATTPGSPARLEVGIYYIAVGAFGNYEGTYTLSVDY